MIGRSIVDTTVRSSAATNTLNATANRIARGERTQGCLACQAVVVVVDAGDAGRTLEGGSIVNSSPYLPSSSDQCVSAPPTSVVNSAAVTSFESGWIQKST